MMEAARSTFGKYGLAEKLSIGLGLFEDISRRKGKLGEALVFATLGSKTADSKGCGFICD